MRKGIDGHGNRQCGSVTSLLISNKGKHNQLQLS